MAKKNTVEPVVVEPAVVVEPVVVEPAVVELHRFTATCRGCGEELHLTHPVKGFNGQLKHRHSCGKGSVFYTLPSTSPLNLCHPSHKAGMAGTLKLV